MDGVLNAIAEPRRRAILRLVRAQERTAGDIAAHFAVTRPAISQHLQVLIDAGLVTMRREGTRRLYRARPEGFTPIRGFLAEFWDEPLQRLQEAAEADERDDSAGSPAGPPGGA